MVRKLPFVYDRNEMACRALRCRFFPLIVMANTLRRFSVALKIGKNKSGPAESSTALAEFLQRSKQEYLKAVADGTGDEWTVVMGNEAGDLDTFASSIAFAWSESEIHRRPTVPLIPIEIDDLDLRAENLFALKLAGVHKPKDQLLFLSEVPPASQHPEHRYPSQRFALVDHNKIKPLFLDNNPDGRVVAVIDHREDEGLYKVTASPRIVQPCGSCCSLIAELVLNSEHIPEYITIPRELATLLLCGIVIDTDGLRPGGKALQLDRDAAASLIPNSTYGPTITPSLLTSLQSGSKPNGNVVYEEKSIKELAAILSAKKTDISHLGTRDLLRRDYKEYDYVVDWIPGRPTVRVGLSTVPLALKEWAKSGTVESEILDWMQSRKLNIHGAISSFKEKTPKKDKEAGVKKNRSRREQIWLVVGGWPESPEIDVEWLSENLWTRLEADDKLQLAKHPHLELNKHGNSLPKGVKAKVYQQGDPAPTRKYTAPLLKTILTTPPKE